MTKPGIYIDWKGNSYRVLMNARNSTVGPGEGRDVVVYVDLRYGYVHVRDEEQFQERVWKETGLRVESPAELSEEDAARTCDRFRFGMAQLCDADAAELYTDLHEMFVDRKPAP